MSACMLGCDHLFELGYVYEDAEGISAAAPGFELSDNRDSDQPHRRACLDGVLGPVREVLCVAARERREREGVNMHSTRTHMPRGIAAQRDAPARGV